MPYPAPDAPGSYTGSGGNTLSPYEQAMARSRASVYRQVSPNPQPSTMVQSYSTTPAYPMQWDERTQRFVAAPPGAVAAADAEEGRFNWADTAGRVGMNVATGGAYGLATGVESLSDGNEGNGEWSQVGDPARRAGLTGGGDAAYPDMPIYPYQASNFMLGQSTNLANQFGGAVQGQGADIYRSGFAGQLRDTPTANYAQANQAREYGLMGLQQQGQGLTQQQANLTYLDAVQRGTAGPSLAEQQMARGTQDALRAQLAASQGGPGGFNPAAQAQAIRAGESLYRGNVQDTGMLRAQEQATARGQYASALGQYQQGAGAYGASALGLQGQDAAQAQAAAQQRLAGIQANDAYTQAMLGQAQGYYGTALDAYRAQQEGLIRLEEARGRAQSDANASRSQMWAAANQSATQRQAANVGAAASLAGGFFSYLSDERSKERIRSADREIQALRSALADRSRYSAADAPEYRQQYLADETRRRAAESTARYPTTTESYDRSALDAAQRRQGGTVTPPAAAASLGAVEPYAFRYKPDAVGPTAPAGQRYGMMAQDLERTPAGQTAVVTDPTTGRKSIDTGQLAILDSMATGDIQRQLEEQQRQIDRLQRFQAPPTRRY